MGYTIAERDQLRSRVLSGGVGRSSLSVEVDSRVPYAVDAAGFSLTDDEGRVLIDVNNNMTVNLHGHAHPQIVATAEAQMRRGLISLGVPNDCELDLADSLVQRIPWGEQVRFANSGTEAVMLAIRVARAATGRDEVIIFDPSYHGTADAVLPSMGDYGARGVPRASDRASLRVPPHAIDVLEGTVRAHKADLAAIVIDLCSSRAGMIPLTVDYVHRARELADEVGAYLIIDEVVTFRHAVGGYHSQYGVTPDLLTLGKTIGGGFPIGAVVGTAAALAELDPGRTPHIEHGGTFTANPVTMAAGTEALRLFDAAEVDRLNRLTKRLADALTAPAADCGWSFRAAGSVFRLWPELSGASERTHAQHELYRQSYQRGLLTTASGLCCLSTPMNDAVIDDIAQRQLDALAAVSLTSVR